MHTFRPERIDGERRDERRVDPAREAEDDFAEAVLADVVPEGEHERPPHLLELRLERDDRAVSVRRLFTWGRQVDDGKQGAIRIFLKYGPGWERVITDLQRVSKPGCRIYCGKGEIPRVYGGLGINILSTSRGVMTGREAAKTGVGGEILCNVW